MGKTLEGIFISEFRREVANVGYKNIYNVPLPPNWSGKVSGTEIYAVRGIEVDYYRNLNRSLVRKLPSNYTAKRRIIDKATRGFAKDSDGQYVYEDFPKPSGSMIVVSKRRIDLPYSEYKKKVSNEGYGYIDFIESKDGIEYLYVIPKSVLYHVNQTALVLSVKNMKNFSGSGYVTWDSGVIFLHIIPYNPSARYEGSIVLKTGYSLDYNDDIKALLSYWKSVNFIPDIQLCALSDGTNLALKGTSVGYDSYIPVDSLAVGDKEIYGSGNLEDNY